MKKNLQLTAMAVALSVAMSTAQTTQFASKNPPQPGSDVSKPIQFSQRQCGTPEPGAEWDAAFNQKVQEFVANLAANKTSMVPYTIPVIVHVIHTGQAVGVFPNLQQGQINSQITVLNQDFASNGLNVGNCPSTFTASKANTDLTFCLAQKNPTGGTLAEPGIDRINALTMSAPLTGTFSSKDPANTAYNNMYKFQAFIDGYIKANTIWDPTRYMNIWITNEQGAVGLLGYATFPTGTGLTGITGNGGATNDGLWCYSAAFGSNSIFPSGTYTSIYNKGRTAVHEIGHWVGLRHIWGDGTCLTDYCNDTPPAQTANYSCSSGCTSGCFTHPYKLGTCSGNTTGEMTMNFMDYTDDACMYLFTNDQKTRIQTAMANGTYRNQLSTSATTLCSISAAAPVANISIPATGCKTTAITTTNSTTGNPTPTYVWTTNPAAGVTYNPNNTAAQPAITFANNGTYTVTCAATNSLGTNSNSKVITINTCTTPAVSCNDTLTNFKATDTLFCARSASTSPGYVGGNNGYGDLQKAEWYSSTGLASNSKIVGGIVLFYRHATANIGTKGTSNIQFAVYNGNNTSGPSGAAVNTYSQTINNILASSAATSSVSYCGNPSLAFTSNIIRPFSFNFSTASTITADFIMAVKLPTTTGDTLAIFHTSGKTATFSTAWEQWSDNSWNKFNDGTTNSWQLNSSLAILPKIACVTDVVNFNGISGNIAVFPNPSNGQFNFAITMPKASDLNFTVINNIGQVVYTKVEKGVGNAIVGMDLSHLAKGIYFVNIIDSTGDKVTKKIIIE